MVLTDHLSRLRKLPAADLPVEEDSDTQVERVSVRRQPQRRLTTTEFQLVVETYLAGSSMSQLAAEFHVHRTTIAACLRKHGVPKHRQGIPPSEIEAAATYYRDGWSLARLADHYGCSGMTVREALTGHGVNIRPRRGWAYDA